MKHVMAALGLIAGGTPGMGMASADPSAPGVLGAPDELAAVAPETDTDHEPRQEVEDFLNSFVAAIQEGDDEAIKQFLSREMLERLDADGDGRVDEEELEPFSAPARHYAAAFVDQRLVVEQIELLEGGTAAEVRLSWGGVDMPKPQYLRLEADGWKYGSTTLQHERAPTATFVVKNHTNANQAVSCDAPGQKVNRLTVGKTARATISCEDMCPGWWSGARFYYKGGAYTCVQSPGIDFNLWSGKGVCDWSC